MSKEIERKFLVKNFSYRELATKKRICQGYICAENDRVVRVRIYGEQAFLTVKNATIGFSRDEFEYPIPLADAEAMLQRCCLQPIIEKVRYKLVFGNFLWEIDEFSGENNGLVIAEIELPSEETRFEKPDFVGEEVTADSRYYNANLIKNPYRLWKK